MTVARFGKLALMLSALLLVNAFLYILVTSEAAEFGQQHLGKRPPIESGPHMVFEMLAVLTGLVVVWALGAIRTLRSALVATGVVQLAAALLPLFR